MRTFLMAIIALAGLSGCATIIEGTGQSIALATAPPGATCTVDRDGGRLGQVVSAPGSIRVDKSKSDIMVTCTKPGFQTASVAQSPTFSGTTFGNIIVGGLVGAAVDAASGANFNYPPQVTLALAPETPVAPPPAPAPVAELGPPPRRPRR